MSAPAMPPVREGLSFRGKHWRLWVGLDGVARGLIEGDHDRASAEDILEALGAMAEKVPERPFRLLLYAHRTLRLAPEARERFVEACRAHVTVRLVLVRPSPLARIQARAIARHSGREFNYYDSEPEALEALGVAAEPPRHAAAAPAIDVGLVDFVS